MPLVLRSIKLGEANWPTFAQSLKQAMNAPFQQDNLQEKILQNVEAVIGLQDQKRQDLPKHHRLVESIATSFGRPWGLVSHLIRIDLIDLNIPLFSLREEGTDAISLLISTGVLIYQTRQEEASDERTHLMLQLNLITEQKIAKLIALVEELRIDSPGVRNRLDLEAEAMQETTSPQVVMDILQVTLKQTPAETSSTEK
jgi:uncharacterized membrane protein